MKMKPLLVTMLVTIGGASSAFAQQPLPADWEEQVLKVVKDPARAQRISGLGRRCDEKRQQSIAAVKVAREKHLELFLAKESSAGDRRAYLQTFRDDRWKTTLQAVEAYFEVKGLVSKKEWKEIWPKGYFALPAPSPSVAGRARDILPAVVADPGRRQRALDVTATLVKAATSNEAARNREASRLESYMTDGAIPRDEYIQSLEKLEKEQAKVDQELINGSIQLQQILTPDEWAALVGRLKSGTP